MIKVIIILCTSFLFQSCLVSRCIQPNTTGYVYDSESRKPLADCSVGGVMTDSMGYYEFKEIRRREFTFIGFEAPPLNMQLTFSKDGYFTDTIKANNPHGGGMKKGAHRQMDTVFLRKN